MEYSLELAVPLLRRTPSSLRDLLLGLPDEWTLSNEGPDSWSPYQVVGHLVHIEECDWIDRTTTILAQGDPCTLEPVDREAGFSRFAQWSMADLLERFQEVRATNLQELDTLVTVDDLTLKGIHPTFGEVTLSQLLATWVVHDLNHFHQIVKTMAKQYTLAIGPWWELLPIVHTP